MPLVSLASLALVASAATPHELGDVPWSRNLDAARMEAARTGKPVLVLFNEVPGCSTVNVYADDVLTDPFVLDAAALFVAVFVSNNDFDGEHGAVDRAAIARYAEPTWNNPVLRIVDANGAMLAPRITHDLGRAGLLRAMVTALDKASREVPPWLRIVADEPRPAVTKTFACACFWEGEASLGARAGVKTTEAGFIDGREVVRVTVDADRASALDRAAQQLGYEEVTRGAFRAAPARDDKHALKRTSWASVAMTPAQRTRVNAAVAAGEDPSAFLAPHQRGAR